MIKHEVRPRSVRLQLESHDRIRAFGPGHYPPGLHDSFIGDQFHVAADDMAFEELKRAADFTIDLGWSARELGELLTV